MHVAIANANPGHNFVQLFGIRYGLFAGANVGLGHNFQQRCACTIQVNAALANEVFVQRFARVFFQVRAHQANGFFLVAHKERHLTALHHGNFKLTDLIALGQIGVEVILARKNTFFSNVRTHRQTQFNGAFHSTFVHHRQCAWQSQIHRTRLRVGLGTKRCGCTAENFALRRKLGVGFKANDHFVALDQKRFLLRCHFAPPG